MSDAPERIRLSFMGGQLVQTLDPSEGDIEYVRADIAVKNAVVSYSARIAELEAEMCEMYEEVLIEMSTVKDGWYVTNARSGAVYAGDQLVKMGQWERDDTRGYGRVQWYRPLTRSKEARDE